MSDLFEEPDNASPLTPEERDALIPAHITYRRELNEAEQENVYRAQDWALARRRALLLASGAALLLAACATPPAGPAQPPIVFVHGNGDTAAL